MSKTLITGMPGIGKSTLVRFLNSQECLFYDPNRVVVDANLVPGLSGIYDLEGSPTAYDATAANFVATHQTKWDSGIVTRLVEESAAQPFYIAGVSHNIPDIVRLGLFDHLIYLDGKDEALRARLTSPDRHSPTGFGRKAHPAQIDATIALSSMVRTIAGELGAHMIDTTELTVPEIGAMVLRIGEGIEVGETS